MSSPSSREVSISVNGRREKVSMRNRGRVKYTYSRSSSHQALQFLEKSMLVWREKREEGKVSFDVDRPPRPGSFH